ncbi:MAG TPA: cytochrome c3 family protein [Chthonomonadales bacterium]|nr:cytochrome c3 family protein [Chthonomonadales bacterium]
MLRLMNARTRLTLVLFAGAWSLVILAAALAQPPPARTDPHRSGAISLPAGASEVAYCDGCHKTGCPTQHPELTKLAWPASGRVYLGVYGEITCSTCHKPGFRHASDAYRARDQRGLCQTCHTGAHALSDAHNSGQKCIACHVVDQAELARSSPAEAAQMRPSADDDCIRCHYDGPITHPVGIPNTKKKAPDLPLGPGGVITCVTCHIGHKQQDRFGLLLRKDNRRGGLCLSCHDDL